METKKFWQSITVWAAGIIALLQTVPEIVTQINTAIPGLALTSNPMVIKALSIIGAIVAIYGRFTAKTIIK